VLHAVVLTQYRRVTDGRTDGRTDGIAIANTALAMRALRGAVKNVILDNLLDTVHLLSLPVCFATQQILLKYIKF